MNRREFIRSVIISSALVATGMTGFAEMALLIQKNQPGQQIPTLSSVQTKSSLVQSVDSTQQQITQAQTTPSQTAQTHTLQTTQQTETTSSTTTQNTSTTTSPTSSQAPAGYVLITQLSSLAGQTSAYFTHPNYGSSIFVNVSSQWKASAPFAHTGRVPWITEILRFIALATGELLVRTTGA